MCISNYAAIGREGGRDILDNSPTILVRISSTPSCVPRMCFYNSLYIQARWQEVRG